MTEEAARKPADTRLDRAKELFAVCAATGEAGRPLASAVIHEEGERVWKSRLRRAADRFPRVKQVLKAEVARKEGKWKEVEDTHLAEAIPSLRRARRIASSEKTREGEKQGEKQTPTRASSRARSRHPPRASSRRENGEGDRRHPPPGSG